MRTKNTRNILIKNLLDTCIGAIVWWGGLEKPTQRKVPVCIGVGVPWLGLGLGLGFTPGCRRVKVLKQQAPPRSSDPSTTRPSPPVVFNIQGAVGAKRQKGFALVCARRVHLINYTMYIQRPIPAPNRCTGPSPVRPRFHHSPTWHWPTSYVPVTV